MEMKVKKLLRSILFVPVIIFVLLEEVFWNIMIPVMNFVAQIKLVAQLEHWIYKQNKYVVFSMFVGVMILMLPFKFLGMWFMGNGQFLFGASVYVLAKFVGTALFVRLFKVGKEKLLDIYLFKALYNFVEWIKEKVHNVLHGWKAYQILKERVLHLKDRIRKLTIKYKSRKNFLDIVRRWRRS